MYETVSLEMNSMNFNGGSMEQGMGANTALLEKKFELLIERHVKQLKEEIAQMKSAMQLLADELERARGGEIKRESNSIPVQMTLESPMPSGGVKIQNASSGAFVPPQQMSGAARNSNTVSRPRYGDYKPEDVDIGKMFYFGGKRR